MKLQFIVLLMKGKEREALRVERRGRGMLSSRRGLWSNFGPFRARRGPNQLKI